MTGEEFISVVPAGLPFSLEAWRATPKEVRDFLLILMKRLEALEERVSTNSKNSSAPPSSDRPGSLPNRKKKGGGTQGGQHGHRGAHREQLPIEQVTSVEHVIPEQCQHCGTSLLEQPTREKWTKQVIELPPVSALVTEIRMHQACCPGCAKYTTAAVPATVPSGSFGPRLMAFAAMLTGRYRMSRRDVEDLLGQSLGIPISLGSVSNCEAIVGSALEKPHEEIRLAVQGAPVANIDDTTWYQGNSRAVLWNANTPGAAYYRITSRKDTKTAKDILGHFSGVLGSDRASTYNFYTAGARQLCWAHLDRHFVRMSERGGKSKKVGQWGLAEVDRLFQAWRELRSEKISRPALRQRMKSIRARVGRLLLKGTQCGNARTERTCGKILCDFSFLWTFAQIEGVEPTNNSAEQALRPGVRWRRTSFGSQSDAGSRFAERFLSVAETCRRQGTKLLDYLTSAVDAHNRGHLPLPTFA